MARPREFERDAALTAAIEVFWTKGFAATSTEDLVQAMGIGRQSFYNAFGDKRRLYLEALETYQRNATSCHIGRLTTPASPLEGLRDLLVGLIPDDDALRCRGCLGAGSVGEFGVTDPELVEMREKMVAVFRVEGRPDAGRDRPGDRHRAGRFLHRHHHDRAPACRSRRCQRPGTPRPRRLRGGAFQSKITTR
jgi:AcrR family transcriptional regulator